MSVEYTIKDFPKLRSPHVRMKDEAAVLRTINEIARGGANKLQFVTDFDRTVTKQHVNGVPVKSSFVIFEQSPLLPEKFKQESKVYFNKFRPIENDTSLPLQERIAAMEEWMVVTRDLVTGLYISEKEIRRLAQIYGSDVRERTKELFEILRMDDVPVLVFSAGLGDMVAAILQEHNFYSKNVNVISNFLKFDGEKIVGFKNKILMHVFNKNEHSIENEYFNLLKERSNVILMGDMTGDANMVEGVQNLNAVLKIGFFYDSDEEKNLPLYLEKFDIVLIDDQTMDVPLEILKKVL